MAENLQPTPTPESQGSTLTEQLVATLDQQTFNQEAFLQALVGMTPEQRVQIDRALNDFLLNNQDQAESISNKMVNGDETRTPAEQKYARVARLRNEQSYQAIIAESVQDSETSEPRSETTPAPENAERVERRRGIGAALSGLRNRITGAFREGGAIRRVADVVGNSQPLSGVRGLIDRVRGRNQSPSETESATSEAQPAPATTDTEPAEDDSTEAAPGLVTRSKEWLKNRLTREIPAAELSETIRTESQEVRDALGEELSEMQVSLDTFTAALRYVTGELESASEELSAETRALLEEDKRKYEVLIVSLQAAMSVVKRKRNTASLVNAWTKQTLQRYEQHQENDDQAGMDREQQRLQEILIRVDELDPREADTGLFSRARREALLGQIQGLFAEAGKIDIRVLMTRINKDPELRDALLATGGQLGAVLLLPGATLASGVAAPIKAVHEERKLRRAEDGDEVESALRRKYNNLTNRWETAEESSENEESRDRLRWLKAAGKAGLNILTSFENALAKVRVAPDRKRAKVSRVVAEMRENGQEYDVAAQPSPEQMQAWLESRLDTGNPRELMAGLQEIDTLLSHLIDLDLFGDEFSPVMLEKVFGERMRSLVPSAIFGSHTYDTASVQRELLEPFRAEVMTFVAELGRRQDILQVAENTGGFTGMRLRRRLESLFEKAGVRSESGSEATTRAEYRNRRAKDLYRGLYRGEIYGMVTRGFIFDLLTGRIQQAGENFNQAGASQAPAEGEVEVPDAPEVAEIPDAEPQPIHDGFDAQVEVAEPAEPVEMPEPVVESTPDVVPETPAPEVEPVTQVGLPEVMDTGEVHQDYVDAYNASADVATPEGSLSLKNADGGVVDGSAILRQEFAQPDFVISQMEAADPQFAETMDQVRSITGGQNQFEQIIVDIERAVSRTLNPQEYTNLAQNYIENFSVGDGVTTPIEQIALTDDVNVINEQLAQMDVLVS